MIASPPLENPSRISTFINLSPFGNQSRMTGFDRFPPLENPSRMLGFVRFPRPDPVLYPPVFISIPRLDLRSIAKYPASPAPHRTASYFVKTAPPLFPVLSLFFTGNRPASMPYSPLLYGIPAPYFTVIYDNFTPVTGIRKTAANLSIPKHPGRPSMPIFPISF